MVSVPNTQKIRIEQIPFTAKVGYGIGDIGCNIFIVSSGLFLLYFLTNIIGVEPALAGLALLFPKLWDVVSDPIMGAISDATSSRMGRRRPYLLLSAIPFGLSFFVMFLAPHHHTDMANAVHVALLFALVCTFFTVFNVPYSSMVAEMSDDYNERISITSYRMGFASAGGLLAGGLAMPLVTLGGGNEDGFRFMSLIFGAAIILCCLLCFRATKSVKTREAQKHLPSIGKQIKIALRNVPFLCLMVSYFFQAMAVGVLMAGLIYYVKHIMKMPETAMGIIFPIFLGTAIVFIPLWAKVGGIFGKIKAYTVGIGILIVMLISLFFTTPSYMELFYVQIFVLGIGFSSFQLFPFSMLPDTIEFDEMQSGMRREGIFSGSWSSGQKIAYSVGPSIVGFALSFSGFAPGETQDASVELGIRIVFCAVPALLFALSYVPFARYDLTSDKFEEIKQRIREKASSPSVD